MGKHGNSCPRMCSQCQNATPRTVTIVDSIVLVDGEPSGPDADEERQRYYSRRGGSAHHEGRKPKR